jgi:hypothetical protein
MKLDEFRAAQRQVWAQGWQTVPPDTKLTASTCTWRTTTLDTRPPWFSGEGAVTIAASQDERRSLTAADPRDAVVCSRSTSSAPRITVMSCGAAARTPPLFSGRRVSRR